MTSDIGICHAEIYSRRGRGVKQGVVYFRTLVFDADKQEFSLRGVKRKKISSGGCMVVLCYCVVLYCAACMLRWLYVLLALISF